MCRVTWLLQGAVCEGQALQVTLSRNKEVRLPSTTTTASGDSAGIDDEKRTVAFTLKDQRYGVGRGRVQVLPSRSLVSFLCVRALKLPLIIRLFYCLVSGVEVLHAALQGEDVEKYVKGACRPTKTVFVANVHEDALADDVAGLFKQYGQVLKFTFKKPKNESSKTKLCIMELENEERVCSFLLDDPCLAAKAIYVPHMLSLAFHMVLSGMFFLFAYFMCAVSGRALL